MATLLQSISEFIDNITVTDRQEENINASVANLTSCLKKTDNGIFVDDVFTNGSWERDTIIRPLNDVDLFAVLDFENWKDENGNLPSPQSVLTKIKNYLNEQHDYKDKVKQDRPCVTVHLSDKNFDVLPCFETGFGGYYIPSYDLQSWIITDPKKLTNDLNSSNRNHSYKVKPTIKAIKSWNREYDKLVPPYHIEEVAITVFSINSFTNYEELIRLWFNNAEHYLSSSKFKSITDYESAINKIRKVKGKLNDAAKAIADDKEDDAKEIWKEIFGRDFPVTDLEEAKQFSKSMQDGTLKVAAIGMLTTTVGKSVPASGGFYGEELR